MNVKHSIIALGAAGATAALVFGGSAVSTAWSQDSSGNVHADAAKFGNTITTGSLSLTNALPGDSSDPATVGFTNSGSTPQHVVFSMNPAGSGLGDLAQYVLVEIPSLHVKDVQLSRVPTSWNVGNLPVGASGSLSDVTLKLADDAPTSIQGKSLDAVYTVTATATHGN